MAIVSVRWIEPPEPISDERRAAALAELERQPDRVIDYGDIPPLTEEEFAQMVPFAEAMEVLKAEYRTKQKHLTSVTG